MLKWRIAPHGFGFLAFVCLIALALALIVGVPVAGFNRFQYARAEHANRYCPPAEPVPAGAQTAAQVRFTTDSLCSPTGYLLERGSTYEIVFTVTEPWADNGVETDPTGFYANRTPWRMWGPAILARRMLGERWFQPVLKIVPSDNPAQGHLQVLHVDRLDRSTFSAIFEADATGDAYLFVNDAVVPLAGDPAWFYRDNNGAALIKISRLH